MLLIDGKSFRLGARRATDNLPGKVDFGVHPFLLPGATALKCPSHIFRRQLRPTPKKFTTFPNFRFCGAQLAPENEISK